MVTISLMMHPPPFLVPSGLPPPHIHTHHPRLPACSLPRPHIHTLQVGALHKLKSDMVTISLMIEAQLLQELHSRVFLTTQQQLAAAAAAVPGSSGGSSRLAPQQQQQQQQGGVSGQEGSSSSMPSYVLDALQQSGSFTTPNGSSGGGGSAAAAAAVGVTTGPGTASGTVGELVSCLMSLDALEDAKLYLLLHARAGVRQMVLR